MDALAGWLMVISSALVLLACVLTARHQRRVTEASEARTRRVAEVERSRGIAAGFTAGWHG